MKGDEEENALIRLVERVREGLDRGQQGGERGAVEGGSAQRRRGQLEDQGDLLESKWS